MLNQSTVTTLLLACLAGATPSVDADSLKGFAQLSWVYSDQDEDWLSSWLRGGTGLTRFDQDEEDLQFNQAVIEGQLDVSDSWSIDATALLYRDGETELGVTEALLTYKPLTEGLRHQVRLGAFYPLMSLENVAVGWHSPYTYSFSAINSWLAEELRILGAEYQLTRAGRQYNSPHSWTLVGSVFGGNDGLGTLLSWRGWALHDRQTLLGERVNFADYPSFIGLLEQQPAWVDPFKETDHKLGYYVGAHWRFKSRSDLRVYFYDNRGDGEQQESSGQYAWDTQFISLAWQYRFNRNTRLLTQWMSGNTQMGKPTVDVDFSSYYLMLSHKLQQHRLSVRYDWFDTTERDDYAIDPNDSQGYAWTIAWRYPLNDQLEIGAEHLQLTSSNESRTLWGWDEKERQRQTQLVVNYRF
mgnify:CR=1 FL=1|tara:strand:- start:2948 stop:4183 length:1236 start_codon:yes stop_codon:yes gene_type:complete